MITFRLYERNGGAQLAILPDLLSYEFSTELSDVGALRFDYPLDGINAELLDIRREVALFDENGVEIANARFQIESINSDPTSHNATYSIQARSLLARLEGVLVYPEGGINSGESSRLFEEATPGAVLNEILTDANARLALGGIDWDFDGVSDSLDNIWQEFITQEFPARNNVLSVIRSLIDFGLLEVSMSGRVLRCARGNGFGVDKSAIASPVVLRRGLNLTDSPIQISADKLTAVALVEGEDGVIFERFNQEALDTYGRIESSFAVGGMSDEAEIAPLADAYLSSASSPARQVTVGVPIDSDTPRPFKDFNVGDFIFIGLENSVEKMRVRQITYSSSSDGDRASVTLGDRIFESEIRNARKLSAITSGSVLIGNGSIPAKPSPADSIAPAAPSDLNATSSAYVAGGEPKAEVSLVWNPPTTNSDLSPLKDLRQYEIQKKPQGSDTWEFAGITDQTTFKAANLVAGQGHRFRVIAIDSASNRSASSPEVAITAANITSSTGMAPSAPTSSTRLGTLSVKWDGLNSSGGDMPADFSYLAIHLSTTDGFTPSNDTYKGRLNGAGVIVFSDLSYGVTYYIKFVAFNKSAVASSASAQASAIVQRLVDTDLIAGQLSTWPFGNGVVSASALQDGSVSASKLVDGSVTGSKISVGAVGADQIAANAIISGKIAAGAVTAGTIAALSIQAGDISANAITADKISAGAISAEKISAGAITADKISAGAISADKISAGAITADKIGASAVSADKISGGTISSASFLATSSPYYLQVGNSSDYSFLRVSATSSSGVTVNSLGFQSSSTAGWTSHCYPFTDSGYQLGTSSYKWTRLWASTSTISTSDERLKTDIQTSPLGLEFLLAIRPVSFRWKVGERQVIRDENGEIILDEDGNPQIIERPGVRNHYGFIAQEIRQVLSDIDAPDFAGFVQDDLEDPDSPLSLSYEQFISPIVKAIQELATRVETLENQS